MSIMEKVRNSVYVPLVLASGSVMAAPGSGVDATALTSGIDSAKPIIIAVGTAIFGLIGILIAIRYAKRAAS